MWRPITTRFEQLGLQRRIMLYVSAGLVIFTAIFGFVALKADQQSTDLVLRERLLVAQTEAQAVDNELEHTQGELDNAGVGAASALASDNPAGAQAVLRTLYTHWNDFHHLENPCRVSLTDPRGLILLTEPMAQDLVGQDLSQRPDLQNAFRSQSEIMADGIALDGSAHPTIDFAVPIRAQAQVIGWLVGSVDRAHIGQRLEPELGGQEFGYAVEVIDNQGHVIATNSRGQDFSSSPHLQLVASLLRAGQSAARTHVVSNNGEERDHVVAFAPVRQLPWGVVIEQEVDEALALPRNLQTEVIAFGVLALFGGLALAWGTTRAVVHPVNALTHAAHAITQGDLDHPLDVSGGDEVGALARTFDEMRTALRTSRDEIARWNHELEARVQQRTRELAALVESSHALTATLKLDALFEILMKETREVMPSAEGVALFLFEPQTERLAVRSTFGFDALECSFLQFQKQEAIAGKVFTSQMPALLTTRLQVEEAMANLSDENRTDFMRAVGLRQIESGMGVPLVSKGVRLGALVLYNFTREGAFTEPDVPILQAFADQAAAAIENARLYASVQEKEAARTALLNQAIQAQEEERRRVAREIHDELGQLLTRLSINLKMCEKQIAAQPTQAADTLAATQALVWQTIEQAHRLIVELRPTLLDELGLEAALREELKTRLVPLGVETDLQVQGAPDRLAPSLEITVFRIAQEAISNIARHAHATHAQLSLRADDVGGLQVLVEDDGVGLCEDWQSANNGHRPLGLLGMQERASLLGGTLTIEPRPPHGTRVLLRVQLDGSGARREQVH